MARMFGNSAFVKQQTPHNHGSNERAQKRLDHIIARANDQFETALSVDTVNIQLWSKTEQGRFCTCQNIKKTEPRFSNPDTDPTSEEIAERHDTNLPSFVIKSGKIQKQTPLNQTITKKKVNDDKLEPPIRFNSLTEQDSLSEGDQEINDLLALISKGDDSNFIMGGESTQCGICFSTGYLEGYKLVNGQRFIFDASLPYQANGFTVDKTVFPYQFTSEFATRNNVTWLSVELPTFFVRPYNINIRNNTKHTTGLKAEVRLSGTLQWFDLTEDFLSARLGQATVVDIRVRPAASNPEGLAVFSHLEFVIQYTDWFKGQIPPLSPSESMDRFRQMIDTSIVLSSRVNEVKSSDVIYCDKYDTLFKVSSVTDFYTAKRQVAGWNTVSCRLIQSYEQLSLLRLFYNRTYNFSWEGLAQIQGEKVHGNSPQFARRFRKPKNPLPRTIIR